MSHAELETPFIIDDSELFEEQLSSTPLHADPVKDYLREAARVPLLDAAQEVELSRQIEAGLYAGQKLLNNDLTSKGGPAPTRQELEIIAKQGQMARNHMIEANLRFVISIAKRYHSSEGGMTFLDVIQEGNAGLIHAIEKFDYTKGFKFSTYAGWWIRQAITRGISNQDRIVRLPVAQVESVSRLKRASNDMTLLLGRTPSPEELAAELDMTPEKVVDLQLNGRQIRSLNLLVGDNDTEFGELLEAESPEPFEVVLDGLCRDAIDKMLGTLRERDAAMIKLHFGLVDGQTRSYVAIGEMYGVTSSYVRQVVNRNLARLRRSQDAREQLAYFQKE